MELHQLRYFLEAAQRRGLQAAARAHHVTPSAVSRGIAAIEAELDVRLFDRGGRSLALTPEGAHLAERAREILDLVERLVAEVRGPAPVPELVLAGRETLLSHFGLPLAARFRQRHPGAAVRLLALSGKEALAAVERGDAHVSVTVQRPPARWSALPPARMAFETCVGTSHPLAARRGAVPVAELLSYEFASPAGPIFGRVARSGSADGWRDDVHPRRIAYVTESAALLAELLQSGLAVGYVPDYWARRHGLTAVEVGGCDFVAGREVFVAAKRHREAGWLDALLDAAGGTRG